MAHVLNPELLRRAYANGYFPMPHPDTGEILWFRPDPRAIIPLEGFHRSKSLQKTLRKKYFEATYDLAFNDVMKACADREEGTWITQEFLEVYGELHAQGDAHSVEIWYDGKLAGGVYGVTVGGAFFAESKFHSITDASKVALHFLVERLREKHFQLLEVQFMTPHLATLGAVEVTDDDYQRLLVKAVKTRTVF